MTGKFRRTFIEDGYGFLNPVGYDDGQKLLKALAGPSADAKKLDAHFRLEDRTDDGRALKVATAPWSFAGSPLVVTDEIRQEVLQLIDGIATLVPLEVETSTGGTIAASLLHTDHVVQDLDHARSEFLTVSSGKIASVKSLVLTDEHAPYPPIFKLEELKTFYCFSQEIADRIKQVNGFSGTIFRAL